VSGKNEFSISHAVGERRAIRTNQQEKIKVEKKKRRPLKRRHEGAEEIVADSRQDPHAGT